MRKSLSAAIALLLLVASAMPVFAESMQISTKSDVDYQIAFPASLEIPWETGDYAIGSVTATKLLIEPGKTVKIGVASANSNRLVHETNATQAIQYTLTGANAIAFLPGEVSKAFPLRVQVAADQWAAAASGTYKETLTFSVSYEDAN